MIKLLTVVGARPQIIKAAALSRAITNRFRDQVKEVILHTGQHYDDSMSEVFFNELQIPHPDHQLSIGSASHGLQTGRMLEGIESVILNENPDGLVLYGDTNSTLAGALAGAKLHVPVIHIEAGLRSFNKSMPEEINRITCDHVSTLLFAPTQTGIDNLRAEGIIHHSEGRLSSDHQGVYHSGDIMFDNTLHFRKTARERSHILEKQGLREGGFMLATIHRPANTDSKDQLDGIIQALGKVAADHRIPVVLPLHPRTRKILMGHGYSAERIQAEMPLLKLIPPVSFLDMVRLEAGARLLLTDSGGVQKEAWFMEKPVVVLREETEWVEIIEAGNGILAGASPERIVRAAGQFLENPPASFPDLFGDGDAAGRILEAITSGNWR